MYYMFILFKYCYQMLFSLCFLCEKMIFYFLIETITLLLIFINILKLIKKNDLKNTCLYYTNRYLLISLRVEVEILTVYLKNLLLSVFINKWGGGFVLPGFCGVADRDCR